MKKKVVLLSGGQDSTTCLAWAIKQWGRDHIWPIVFYYQQRHQIEVEQALKIANYMGTQEPKVLDVSVLSALGGAALTDPLVSVSVDAKDSGNSYAEARGLPSTFVPGRNMLFFTLAAAYGAKIGSNELVTGVCATDRAGYPDCRVEFVEEAEHALSLALDQPVHILAPLLRRSKAETWALADSLDVLDLVIEMSHTCYHGIRKERHEWGYGCGECGACEERARGFAEFKEEQLAGRMS